MITFRHRQASPQVVLGSAGGRFLRRPVVLGPDQLKHHLHLLGTTGQGKSVLLSNIFVQLHNQGRAVGLVDPHGDLAIDCLRILQGQGYFGRPDAYTRLWYIDFRWPDRFLPLNVLKQPYPDQIVVDAITEVCLRAWPALGDGAAPTFENILRHGLLALCQAGRLPLTQLSELLTDQQFRNQVLARVADPQVHRFFRRRYEQWGRDAIKLRESTLNRVDLLTFSPTLRFSLGQPDNRLDFRRLMDEQISVIFNLGGLDVQTQTFLGTLICHGFEVAAFSRADVDEAYRPPLWLLIDEFSMFSSRTAEGLARILSLTRKYGLLLGLAHQTFSPVSERLRSALQNTTPIAFRLGRGDAEWAAKRFGAFDPLQIKHDLDDPAQQARVHPLFAQLAEQWEGWTKAFEELEQGEAFIRLGRQATKIRTLGPLSRVSREAIVNVRETYARRLMTPISELADRLTATPWSHSPSVPVRQIHIPHYACDLVRTGTVARRPGNQSFDLWRPSGEHPCKPRSRRLPAPDQ
jgi:hypothetical protein